MKAKLIDRFLLVLVVCLVGIGSRRAQADVPVKKILFDTDMAVDCDDAAALWMLHVLAKRGEAEILATGVCGADIAGHSGHCVAVINEFHGRGDLAIVAAKKIPVLSRSSYTGIIRDEYSSTTAKDDQLPDAVAWYRQVLSQQPDGSVTIAALGMFNNMASLLASPPDQFSSLGGNDLVAKKVEQLVVVCGDFPQGVIQYNLGADGKSAQRVFQKWPSEIVVCPGKLGYQLITGKNLHGLPRDNPLRRIYEVFEPYWLPKPVRYKNATVHGRPSWDQAALLYAVNGASDLFQESVRGTIRIEVHGETANGVAEGTTSWSPSANGRHRFLTLKADAKTVSDRIESLMRHER